MLTRHSTLRVLRNTYSRSLSTVANKTDFFGIAHVTSKDVAGSFKSQNRLPNAQIAEKYQPLLQARDYPENREHKVDIVFGEVRLDSKNVPKKHGQFDSTNEKKLYETTDIKQKYVPIDSVDKNHNLDVIKFEVDNYEQAAAANIEGMNNPYKIAEVAPDASINEVLRLFKIEKSAEDPNKYANKPPLTFYFEKSLYCDDYGQKEDHNNGTLEEQNFKLSGSRIDSDELLESEITTTDKKPILIYDPEKDQTPVHELNPFSEEYLIRNEKLMKDFDFDKSIDEEYDVGDKPKKSKNALDYMKQIRAQKIEPTAKGLKHRLQADQPYSLRSSVKLDSQGFRNYSNQVPNWKACRHVDIISHLKKSIVYHNYDILALNKPYGIATHDENRNREQFDVNNLMKEVAKAMKIEKLYLAHRLDKTTTGLLLFATSQKRADNLNKLFKADLIKKTYWCITRGLPQPESAIIDIPIGEYEVAGKIRSCVAPEKVPREFQFSRRFKEARRAVTEYTVLKSTRHVSLVEVKPSSGVKHQIRCHMSFGLDTPILGDHKYSHFSKIAPQTLPAAVLKQLHLRQAKVRTLPMHLHAKSIVIPGAKANGETLFIDAPLHAHFIENLKALNLVDDNIRSKLKF